MRSEYVYIAWAIVIAAFTWQVNQEPDMSWAQQSRIYQTPETRDRAFNDEIRRQNAPPIGVVGVDDRVVFARFRPDPFPWSSLQSEAYGASLILRCGRSYGSASLVNDNQTIVFSAHQIVDEDGRMEENLERCAAIAGTRDDELHRIDWSTLQMGNVTSGGANGIRVTDDWAVVRLSEPMRDITPYRLATADQAKRFENTRLANVSASTDNWPDRRYFGMIAQTCNYMGIADDYRSADVVAYDCDIGRGASGSGMLAHDGSGNVYLFGIVNRMLRQTVQCDRAVLNECHAVGLRMNDALISAIKSVGATTARLERPRQAAPRI